MKQVNIHGPNQVVIDEVPAPEPGPRDAVIRVAACGICGSDLGYINLGGVAGPTGEPMPLGHEFSGVVESVGSEVTGLAVGTRVVANPLSNGNTIGNGSAEGGFAPLVLIPNAADSTAIFPIPDELSLEVAALTEPLSVGLQGVKRCNPEVGEKAVIFGAGPIGLTSLASLRHLGIEDIIAVDLSPYRLDIARKLGATATLNPSSDSVWEAIRDIHGTAPLLGAEMAGSDIYIEASGADVVIDEVLANCKSEARLAILGLHRTPIPVNFLLVMIKSLTIVGSMAYPDDWNEAIELLNTRDLSPMISHRFALEDFDQALATAQNAGQGAKVMILNDGAN